MATTEEPGSTNSGAEKLSAQSGMKDHNVFDRYRTFLEEHFSREDHNAQEVATKHLTVTVKGTFDYVSVEWAINTQALKEEYPEWLIDQWSLCGIRRFGSFTKLDAFPKVIDGEEFLKTSHPNGSHKEYLKVGTPANFAFFLVGRYTWFWALWYSHKKILGPLTLSLTPLRATTKEMWEEIAHILNVHLVPPSGSNAVLENKEALLARFTEKEKAIRADPSMTPDDKDALVERTWALYNLYGRDGE